MPTTASTPNWRISNMSALPGQLWIKGATPGAGALFTLHTDGTPDATLNTAVQHLGATKAGAKVMVKGTIDKISVDEFRSPVISTVGGSEMGISAELAAVNDTNVLTWMLPGIATRSITAATSEQVKIGITAIVYTSAIHIFPLQADQTKYGYFHIYNGLNDTGVAWAISRKEAGFTPISIVGFELTTRAATDTMGCIFKQTGTPIDPWV